MTQSGLVNEEPDPQADKLLQLVQEYIRHARALDDEARAIAQLVEAMTGDPLAAAAFLAALAADRHDETLQTLLLRLRGDADALLEAVKRGEPLKTVLAKLTTGVM